MSLIRRQQASGQPVALFSASKIAAAAARREAPTSDAEAEAKAVPPTFEPQADDSARRIEQLEEVLLVEREQSRTACEAAFAEGRAEGLAQAALRDDERLEILQEAIERASADCVAKIEQRSDLAILLARTALQRIFGAHWQHEGMVEAVIQHDAVALTAGAVIRIRVSPDDFSDKEALTALTAIRGVEIATDSELKSGACVFDLTLGSIDASIPIQARAVDDLLARFVPHAGGAA